MPCRDRCGAGRPVDPDEVSHGAERDGDEPGDDAVWRHVEHVGEDDFALRDGRANFSFFQQTMAGLMGRAIGIASGYGGLRGVAVLRVGGDEDGADLGEAAVSNDASRRLPLSGRGDLIRASLWVTL